MFRRVEQTGVPASVIDVAHESKNTASRLSWYPMVFLPGSPVIAKDMSKSLKHYVSQGVTRVVSDTWPSADQDERTLQFPGLNTPEVENHQPRGISLGMGMMV